MKISIAKQFKEGIITSNPVFVQLLGLCPALAVTTSVINAVGMGAATTAVLVFSCLVISLLRRIVPKQIRIASYIIIISGFTTAVELLIKAYFPYLDASLGLFIPLIAVNCIILGRAEAFASKNKPMPSMIDGVATGIGFTLALVCVALVRELLGTGALFAATDGSGGLRVLGEWYPSVPALLLPAGALLTLGFMSALFRKITSAAEERKMSKAEASEALEGGVENE